MGSDVTPNPLAGVVGVKFGSVAISHGFIGSVRQPEERLEKHAALAVKESGIGQELSGGHGPGKPCRRGTDDGTERQVRADELAWTM